MNAFETRRRLTAFALLCVVPGMGRAVDSAGSSTATFLRFDAVFIPALFLTGSAGKAVDGPAKASAAMTRLSGQWPSLRSAMSGAVPDQPGWSKALQAVQGHLHEAESLASKGQRERAHEALEQVRHVLFEARRSLGVDYALDDFTAYHAVMEKLANATSVQRAAFAADYATARALWRRIEMMSFDAAGYGLSPGRGRQLDQARADESNALSALSQALHAGTDAEVLKAAAAIKPPFVRAYVAFGAPL